jgi:signal transduction histidine kinase
MGLRSRFTVGWYGLYFLVLFSQQVVTLALIVESNRLYARLARSTAAREREREARLMSLDAVVAAIAHEVGQPLAAISIHARTGRNRLTRVRPDVGKAIYSLDAIIDAGRRTSEVIKSIRAMFGKRPGVTTEFDLNDLARTTVSLLDREMVGGKISVEFTLDVALPPVRADQAQMQRVLVNLLTNAIEALQSTRGRPRRIAIRSASPNGQAVVLEVSDNGVGIPSEQMAEVFEAYFTTKATGAGLGLWLCRTMVEAHGGALWASQNPAQGATFHLQLPSSGQPAP